MSNFSYNLRAPNIKAFASKIPKKGDGIKETVLRLLDKYPEATPQQIGAQCGIQTELVERILEADKKRKLEGY